MTDGVDRENMSRINLETGEVVRQSEVDTEDGPLAEAFEAEGVDVADYR